MFKTVNGQIIVDIAVLELLVPAFYSQRNLFIKLPGYYDLFLVTMARSFVNINQYENSTKEYKPFAFPYRIKTKPSIVETDIIEVPKGGTPKNVFKLIYYKGDVFSDSTDYIRASDNTQDIYNMFDDGLADFLPYLTIAQLLEETHAINDTNMPVPIEAIHAIVAERCKNPSNYMQSARFMDTLPNAIISLNPRETVASGTVAGMFGFEDVNSAVMIAANREEKGIVDKASTLEKIILTGKV